EFLRIVLVRVASLVDALFRQTHRLSLARAKRCEVFLVGKTREQHAYDFLQPMIDIALREAHQQSAHDWLGLFRCTRNDARKQIVRHTGGASPFDELEHFW